MENKQGRGDRLKVHVSGITAGTSTYREAIGTTLGHEIYLGPCYPPKFE
ncbi:hypothetical protein NG791_23080 [Laspinema sp. D1]|nr:hypothetical protein [Laspinema sp. D2b]